jgi:NAD(P)-dependent dehydrogenase (short-subunit alcohol dehydrogenase family)
MDGLFDLTGKRVLVTGSSRGIGLATARAFLSHGARVAINGRSMETTRTGLSMLDGAKVVLAPGDVGTVAGCMEIVGAAAAGLGGLDILVNSAGVAEYGPAEECSEETWDRVVDTNLKGTFFCTQAAIPLLRSARGNVVNIGSDAGLLGAKGLSVYCASKGGVVNLTRALALELAPDIRVNCVCPGYTDTDMVRRDVIDRSSDPRATEAEINAYAPLKRIASPVEIAQIVAFLASRMSGFVTGTALAVDGGSTAGPTG